jgi:hypothetical protein
VLCEVEGCFSVLPKVPNTGRLAPMKGHLAQFHSEELYSCEFKKGGIQCAYTDKSRTHLTNHIRHYHDKAWIAENTWTCSICKQFSATWESVVAKHEESCSKKFQ